MRRPWRVRGVAGGPGSGSARDVNAQRARNLVGSDGRGEELSSVDDVMIMDVYCNRTLLRLSGRKRTAIELQDIWRPRTKRKAAYGNDGGLMIRV